MKNIQPVLDNEVCTGCGICNSICPENCIETGLDLTKGYYSTRLDSEICTDCGLCRKVCPVYTWNNQEGNFLVGNVLKIYSGYNCNETHRRESASGGITTSILMYLFQQDIIDAAVVAFRKNGNQLESELRIVSSLEDIYKSKGSVYAPTSYNKVVNEIIESSFTRFAVVGLPCHIEGITRFSLLNRKLKNKIIFKLALVCGHTPSIKGYEYSLKHLSVKKEDITYLTNRGDGWPGFLKIKTNNNTEIKLPYGNKYSWGMTLSSPLFTPSGCKHCVDSTGYNADISICDAWMNKFKSDGIGRSLVLIRNEEAFSILREMEELKMVSLSEETLSDYILANQNVFKEKLAVGKYRNKALVKRFNLYSNVAFSPSTSNIAPFFISIRLFAENMRHKIFGVKFMNDFVLFVFKTLKYLSLKWIDLQKS